MEWDAPTRGKGDGAVTASDGSEVRYFTCERAGATASFMKLELLGTGTSLMEALDER